MRYHGVWQAFPDALAGMPGGEAWLAGINAERPEGERHLAVHEGHITDVMPHDEDVLALAGDALGDHRVGGYPRRDPPARRRTSRPPGGTDLMFTPGRRLRREMRAWAEAVRGDAPGSELDVELLELVGLALTRPRSTPSSRAAT